MTAARRRTREPGAARRGVTRHPAVLCEDTGATGNDCTARSAGLPRVAGQRRGRAQHRRKCSPRAHRVPLIRGGGARWAQAAATPPPVPDPSGLRDSPGDARGPGYPPGAADRARRREARDGGGVGALPRYRGGPRRVRAEGVKALRSGRAPAAARGGGAVGPPAARERWWPGGGRGRRPGRLDRAAGRHTWAQSCASAA